jgi:hypothetical protein
VTSTNDAIEEVLHLLPSVSMLHVVQVGPSVRVKKSAARPFSYMEKIVCSACSRLGVKCVFSFYT